MCNNPNHDDISITNACCLNEDCNYHGPYMLQGQGPDDREEYRYRRTRFGNSHCPVCGHGKFVHEQLLKDPFFMAIEAYIEQEGGD